MRNRNSRLLKSSVKLVVDVIIVKEIGGEESFTLLLLLYCITKKVVALNNINLLFYVSGGQKFIISHNGLKSNCQQGHVPSEGSRVESTCLFQVLKVTIIYGLWSSSIFTSSTSASIVASPSLILNFLPSSYKYPCDYIGPSQINQDYLSISRSLI